MALEKIGVRATIEGLNAFNNGMRKMSRGVDAFGKEALTASKRTEILTGALKKAGIALTAAAAASGALLFSSVKLAARVETLGVVTATLGRNVGKTEKEIRDLEQAIVKEGITLQVARKAIALMIQSNVDLAKATDLASLAQNAAVIAGINSSEAFERLIFVITSGNVRMARTLGLQVSFAQGMEKMAAATGKTAAELTPLERIQARTNEVMAAGANIAGAYGAAMETAGKKVTSLDRLIEESRRTLGEVWLPTYAKVIDFITATLNVWLDMGQVQKDLISSTLGVVTAFVGLLGVSALIGAQIPAAIAGLSSLASALGIVTVVGFSTAAVLGIVAAAIVAVGVAFVMVIKTINRVKLGFKQITDAIKEQEKRTFKTADTFEDYRKEMERVGKVTKRVVGTQEELGKQLRSGKITVQQYRSAIVLTNEALFKSELATRELTEGTSDLAKEMALSDEKLLRLADGFGKVKLSEEELEKQQERLQEQFDKLSLTIDTDVGEQFADFSTKIGDVKTEIQDLLTFRLLSPQQKEDLITLGREFLVAKDRVQFLIREIFTLRNQGITTVDQQEQLGGLRTDLSNARNEVAFIQDDLQILTGRDYVSDSQREQLEGLLDTLDETQSAWDKTTRNLIFNLAEQRLAIDGFTREEIDALQRLAGPEGLGLVDAAGAALLEKIDLLAQSMDEAGDQSDIFGKEMIALQLMMLDPTISANELADAINRIQSKTVTVTTRLLTTRSGDGGDGGDGDGGDGGDETTTIVIRAPTRREELRERRLQHGGFIQAGRAAVIGEVGPEFFLPRQSGTVLSNRFVGAIASLVAAMKSAPALMAAPMTPVSAGAVTNNEFTMNINTNAPSEPIIADFRTMQSMANAT